MKLITPQLHGYLDYFTVIIFLLAPLLLGLTGIAGVLAYALAAIHLAMTLATDFPLGAAKIIPFPVHGWVERIVGPALLLLPFLLGFDAAARNFYLLIGVVIVIVGALTDYRQTQ